MQNNLLNVNNRAEQREQFHGRHVNSNLRDSIAANITQVTREELPSSSITIQPSAHPGLNLRGVVSNLNIHDPLKAFILEPAELSTREAIYDAIACKDLPLSVREKKLDWSSSQVRNLLGMISQDVHPEDQALLKTCFSLLKKVQHNTDMQPELGKKINFLIHKYGEAALYRHVENYEDCCRKVWHYYHPGHPSHPTDDEVFTSDAELAYRTVVPTISRLTKDDIEWIEIVANGYFLKESCCLLAASIKYDAKIKIPPESITETYDSVYLTRENGLANANNQNDYEIDNAECRNDTLTTWERTVNILCCD
ncbi:hypothetical protein [Klebsiella sp. BIGb0407]|uniref:hypothetical protein n=1 Tax=Klebsiella sp. BIGb0407 TaxID=2940603 RepID=UPI002166C2A6|nr:hypothetical protein [Klebsiella sp. BIGb0407]MCS3431534.1 hypothetical protein [Klebsiella sp. BIGb0407]